MSVMVFVLPLLLVALSIVLARYGAGPFRQLRVESALAEQLSAASASVRHRNTVLFTVLVVTVVVMVSVGFALGQSDEGRLLLMSPLIATSAALTVIAFGTHPIPAVAHPAPGTRPRSWQLGPLWLRGVFVFSTLIALLAVVGIGLTADEGGRSLSRVSALASFSASPYPGFFYGAPILGATLILVLMVGACVERLTTIRYTQHDSLSDTDEMLRHLVARVVLSTASAALNATAGIVLILASAPTKSVSAASSPLDELLLGGGFTLVVAAVVLTVLGIRNATREPVSVQIISQPVRV